MAGKSTAAARPTSKHWRAHKCITQIYTPPANTGIMVVFSAMNN